MQLRFNMRSSYKVFIALLVVAVFQVVFYYPQLPDHVASHFSGAGYPNGWSSKTVFAVTNLATVAAMASVFLYLPTILHRFSDKVVSLPNKDYWLAPEQREYTGMFIQNQMLWLGSATLIFLICTMQLVIEANIDSRPVLSSGFVWLLMVYLGYTALWTVKFILKFTRVPERKGPITGT